MSCKTIIYPVRDLAAAKAVFAALLGVEPIADSAYYVGFESDGQHIGLAPASPDEALTGPVPYWDVDDIEARIDDLVAAGATVRQDPTAVGGGRTVALLNDPDGNPIGLTQDEQ